MPYLQEVFEEKAEEDLVMLTVNLREDEATVRQFMQQAGYTFMVALDRVGQSCLIRGIPTTLMIDSTSVIRSIHVGSFADTSQILAELEQVVGRPRSYEDVFDSAPSDVALSVSGP